MYFHLYIVVFNRVQLVLLLYLMDYGIVPDCFVASVHNISCTHVLFILLACVEVQMASLCVFSATVCTSV